MELVLIPNITEKTTKLIEAANTYVFALKPGAKKVSSTVISAEVARKYGVKVERVNISNRLGKIKKSGKRRNAYSRPTIKYAYVKVAEGETIADFNLNEQKS